MSPHLIVKLKSLHVHTQELGIYFELSCLISRGDVKDHISEAIKNRIQNRDPLRLSRATAALFHPLLLIPGSAVSHPEPGFPSITLFLLPLLPLLTPQLFSLPSPNQLFSPPGPFPSIFCLGVSRTVSDHTHCP